jgi:hypothetical protein
MHSDAPSTLPVPDKSGETPSSFPSRPDMGSARKVLTEDQLDRFEKLVQDYREIFSKDKTDIGFTSLAKHNIELLPGAEAFREHPRRQNPAKREAASQTINDLLDKGIVENSESPFASGIVLVLKKDGSYRMCIDFRKLNQITKKDAYPIPRIDDALNQLGEARFFSSLDLTSGFWQVPLREQDKEKTAFSTQEGHFQFTRMPFGLCNATATFQRLMQKVLATVTNKYGNLILCYIDDVLIATRTIEEHLNRIEEVFACIAKAGLKIKAGKCQFFETEVHFLGRIIGNGQVRPNPDAVAKVHEWKPARNVHDVQRILGLANYYREFIKGYASIVHPLTELTKKDTPFLWGEAQQNAMETIQRKLTTEPILALPYVLDTDASNLAVSGILHQEQIIDDKPCLVVIAYGSKILNRSQRNYSTSKREMLAVLTFIEKYACFLAGRPFTVRTDCSSLVRTMLWQLAG